MDMDREAKERANRVRERLEREEMKRAKENYDAYKAATERVNKKREQLEREEVKRAEENYEMEEEERAKRERIWAMDPRRKKEATEEHE